jgi:hypothetical protein
MRKGNEKQRGIRIAQCKISQLLNCDVDKLNPLIFIY